MTPDLRNQIKTELEQKLESLSNREIYINEKETIARRSYDSDKTRAENWKKTICEKIGHGPIDAEKLDKIEKIYSDFQKDINDRFSPFFEIVRIEKEKIQNQKSEAIRALALLNGERIANRAQKFKGYTSALIEELQNAAFRREKEAQGQGKTGAAGRAGSAGEKGKDAAVKESKKCFCC